METLIWHASRARTIRFVVSAMLASIASIGVGVLPASSAQAQQVRAPTPAAVVGPTSPNILLVNIDDGRPGELNYMPQTQALMANARNYVNARVTIPSCCPSRATTFTGRYSHNNGVLLQADGLKLDSDYTLMAYLKRAGYLTAMAGKFLNSWPTNQAPPFFDKWTTTKGGYYNWNANVDGTARTISEYSTTFLARQLRSYLTGFESQDTRPWFAYYAPQATHQDGTKGVIPETKYATAPVGACVQPGEADISDKPPYLGWSAPGKDPVYLDTLCKNQIRTLMSVDDEMAAFFQQLQATGELSNTMVIFMTDNGVHWGEHDWPSKMLPYEPSVRVPLLIRWDGHVTAGTDTRMVSELDLLPTILGVLGVTPLKPLDGVSLFGTAARTSFFSEYFNDPDNGTSIPTWAALTTPTRKYIEDRLVDSAGKVTVFKEYYRLDTDPGELDNVLKDGNASNDPPATELSAWAAQLAAARTCVGAAACSPTSPGPPNAPPTAAFTSSCTALTCAFDGRSSTDAEGPIASYSWSFGDGTTGSGAQVQRTYAAAAGYAVTLTVSDSAGATSSVTHQVTVGTAPGSISFHGVGAFVGNVMTASATVPATVKPGDALLMFATNNVTTTSVTAPTGWTSLANFVTGSARTRVWSRVAATGDAGKTVSLRFGTNTKVVLQLAAYGGTSASSPVAAIATRSDTVAVVSHSTPTVLAGSAGEWLVSYWADKSGTTTDWVPPSGVTSRNEKIGSGLGRISALLADSGSAVPTGTRGGLVARTNAASRASEISIVLR